MSEEVQITLITALGFPFFIVVATASIILIMFISSKWFPSNNDNKDIEDK